MADITWTTDLPDPIEVDFGPWSVSWAFVSPITEATRTGGIPGTRWIQSLRFNNMTVAKSALLEGLLMRLEGQANRLVLHRIGRPAPRGLATGTPLVNGANQTGSSINIDGLVANAQGVYLIGDMLGIGGELKLVTANVNANASGQAAVAFKPALRASPSDNSAIVTAKPTARWIVADPRIKWTEMLSKIVAGHALDLVEVFT